MDELAERKARKAIANAVAAVENWERLSPETRRAARTGDFGGLLRRRITEARWLVRLGEYEAAIRLVNVQRAKTEAAWMDR